MTDTTRPQCLGFIMDGNRRWAAEAGLERSEGHKQGGVVLGDCIDWLIKEQISHGVFYAFSTENWQRSEAEVSYLMELIAKGIDRLSEKTVNVRIIGRMSDFSIELQHVIAQVQSQNTPDNKTTIWIALSYGGRAELVDAVNNAIARGEVVTEETFESLLWTAELPDPDMIVRTGGEQRLSNFLTWKSVYSELYFIEKHWPALTTADFDDILVEYEKRNRRRGK